MRFILLLSLFFSAGVAAQSSLQTTFSGTLRLDHGVAERDLPITVEVRKHTIEFRETCIFLITGTRICFPVTLYPVEQVRRKAITLATGRNSAGFGVSGVGRFGIKYSLKMTCRGCSELVPEQYYTLNGNTLSAGDAALLDEDALPSRFNIKLITQTTVSGKIMLPEEKRATSERQFSVTAYALPAGNVRLGRRSGIKLPAGENSVDYRLAGLPSGSIDKTMQIVLQCTSCAGSSEQAHTPALRRGVSHSNIDFIFNFSDSGYMVPVLDLLLETPSE
ncbi:hypothetical protein GCM10008090_00420 [Arenicella chitinivorans]|uniref:Gliding motility-associated protein GldM C-terminal domain-containing protein n=1 Tax=Arenicella chitinivorans TaxID=1329800 RepID=A0A918RH67_9GAMM|nr:hypothetical protein [Arenicella chitinivorans]GGZ96140.1 hypothetical protein GCM10008090_00420 [Arenicella chitinivorans]